VPVPVPVPVRPLPPVVVNPPPVIINNLPPTIVVIRPGFRVNIPVIPVDADPVVIERVRINVVSERDRCVDEVTQLQQQVDQSASDDQSDLLAQIDRLQQAVQDLENRLQQVDDSATNDQDSGPDLAVPFDGSQPGDDSTVPVDDVPT
jgi:hypothetical protein